MAFIGSPLARLALKFGPPEFFALMGKYVLRGMIAALVGINLALIGMDPMSGTARFGFDIDELATKLEFAIQPKNL